MSESALDAGDRSEPGAADRWFLARGLPAVVRRSALISHVWSRSAPALTGLAVIAANSILIVVLTGAHTVDIAGRPDLPEGIALALLAILVPLVGFAGWLVSRVGSPRRRALIADAAVAVIVLAALFGGPSPRRVVNIALFGIAMLVILALTATGVGSILGWAAELTVSNATAIAGMFVRALPVVLLTFLVFFNTYVWLMTSLISRGRLWLGIGFLLLVAGSFLVSTTLDKVGPVLSGDGPDRLSLAERANVVFVVAVTQVVHVLTVAVMTGGVFLVLGLILISPGVLDAWTRGNGRPDGQVLGMTLPIPEALIQTTMLLTAITFMYLAAKAVSDQQYRAAFVDPMLDDVRETLQARSRYRAARPTAKEGSSE